MGMLIQTIAAAPRDMVSTISSSLTTMETVMQIWEMRITDEEQISGEMKMIRR
jgi:hypothetical protein